MQTQFNNALKLIKEQKDIDACIAGSSMLGYQEGWNQDIDIFCYSEESFRELLFFMKYNSLFQILDKLELHKFNSYIKNGHSSLSKLNLITIKFSYNLSIPVNIIYKKYNKNLFDVLASFDCDLISQGYCLKTSKFLSLRESTGNQCTWNSWNTAFFNSNIWDVKRLCRQFARVVKYQDRGYDLSQVTDKYIELVKDILAKENIYVSEKGTSFYENTQKEFEVVLKILQEYKKDSKISPEGLTILKTLI